MQVTNPNFMYMCSCAGCGTSRGGGRRRRGSRGQRRRVAGGGGTDLRAYIHKSLPNEFAFEHKHSGHIHARMFMFCRTTLSGPRPRIFGPVLRPSGQGVPRARYLRRTRALPGLPRGVLFRQRRRRRVHGPPRARPSLRRRPARLLRSSGQGAPRGRYLRRTRAFPGPPRGVLFRQRRRRRVHRPRARGNLGRRPANSTSTGGTANFRPRGGCQPVAPNDAKRTSTRTPRKTSWNRRARRRATMSARCGRTARSGSWST